MGRLSTCAAAGVADMATSAAAMAAANMGCMNEELLTNQGRARAQPGEASVVRRLEVGMYWTRSEEHTSELQSLMRISYAVFCLQKKKHIINKNTLELHT